METHPAVRSGKLNRNLICLFSLQCLATLVIFVASCTTTARQASSPPSPLRVTELVDANGVTPTA